MKAFNKLFSLVVASVPVSYTHLDVYKRQLQEAARHKLEADMLDAGGIGSITTCLSQAALAGLASFSQ